MSRTLTNGHTNGTSNRLTSPGHVQQEGSLPTWANKETALVFCEILYACVLNDDPDGIICDDVGVDAYARRLKKHFNADHWVHGPSDLTGLRITAAAFELLLSRVDWRALAEHLQAFGQVAAS